MRPSLGIISGAFALRSHAFALSGHVVFLSLIEHLPFGPRVKWTNAHAARKSMLLHEFKWKEEVLQADQPVLVDFWASWCPPCRAMNPAIESLAQEFKVCKVNVDTNSELAGRYGISSIPALLIFKDGRVAARHVGVTPETTLRAEMQRLS
jgi:thioredoxin 1